MNIVFCHRFSRETEEEIVMGEERTPYEIGKEHYKKREFPEALRWYKKAAAQGHAGAMSDIGYMYQAGRGVERDVIEGMGWFMKAVETRRKEIVVSFEGTE